MRCLSDVIAFNKSSDRELALFGQDLFEAADAMPGLDDPGYLKALEIKTTARAALDGLFAQYRIDALLRETAEPAFRIDIVRGNTSGGGSAGLPAIAGYPHLTVPMGQVSGLPVGLSLIGPAWSDADLLRLGAAVEEAAHARRPPRFLPSLEEDATPAFAPPR